MSKNEQNKNHGQMGKQSNESLASEKDGANAAQAAEHGLKELGLQPSAELNEDAAGGRSEEVPGKLARRGRSLAHLDRIIQGGCCDVLKIVVLAMAKDVMNGRSETYGEQFEVVEAVLTELQMHDNLAHLKAARGALA